jgi:hypothetical protein
VTAPFRVYSTPPGVKRVSTGRRADQEIREYLERLIRLIPGEVVGLYLLGSGFIPQQYPIALVGWSAFCLVCVFVVRIYGTSDPANHKRPQWGAVFISAGAFVIWLYTLGGAFAAYELHLPWLGSLLVFGYTFLVPYLYKGDPYSPDTGGPGAAGGAGRAGHEETTP